MARVLLPQLNRFKLDTVAKALGVPLENHHRAVDDAGCTALIFEKMLQMLKEREINNLDQLNELGQSSQEQIKKLLPITPFCWLQTTWAGSICTGWFLVPSAVLQQKAQSAQERAADIPGGSDSGIACEAGELFRADCQGGLPPGTAGIVQFYDYLEIQPRATICL